MPYIKKKLRPPFDIAVRLAKQKRWADANTQILLALKPLGDMDTDGCLNYVFTQLLRKMENLNEAEQIIQVIIYNVFLANPRYFKLERIEGLLFAMSVEFKRREWRDKALRHIERLLRYVVENHYVPYEEKKIAENGDLE